MLYLLDTHLVYWIFFDDDKLKKSELDFLKSQENVFFISHVSLWELSILKKLGKLDFPTAFFEEITKSDFEILPIKINHIIKTLDLPQIHRDPFDRMLVAQAKCENMELFTRDDILQAVSFCSQKCR